MSGRYPVIQVRTEEGHLKVRDGLILCFFMRRNHTEIAQAVWRSLQTYLRATPPGIPGWYVDPDGDTLPLDDSGWKHTREKILERPGALACHVDLWQLEYEVGGYNFEYNGYQLDPLCVLDERAACAIAFSLPTEYLLEHGAEKVRALAIELSRELPFSFGYASFALVSPSGRWYPHRMKLLPLLERYLGLDLYHLNRTSRRIGTGARGAYWLTFLGQPLLGQLGGLKGLRGELPFPEVSFQPLEGERLLLTLGEWPDPIDTREELYLPHYRVLAHLLEPYFPEEKLGLTSLLDTHGVGRWLRRLCQ
ncbi:type VI immunity family protein [Archangium sp.]|uniref:type VI immunity family protein n=1 Tax=Archangium sp. TaxID=1872627 RepID=UPI002D564DD1|nr:type VI immunity family protein [Archangium sp.]HYO52871.1 type VI immunity family protein [Archangium sp.]